MLNADLNKYIASFLSVKEISALSCVSKSVYSSLSGLYIRKSKINLSKYNPECKFKYETLVVDCNKKITLTQIFNKIIYERSNRFLNIKGASEIVIRYKCNSIGWLPKDIDKLYVYSDTFDQPVEDFTNLTYLYINSFIFNHSLANLSNLIYLNISSFLFNQKVDHLDKLLYLRIFSREFNNPVCTLTKLLYMNIHSAVFDQSISNLINLHSLTISSLVFNKPIDMLQKLKEVYINSDAFDQDIKGIDSPIKQINQIVYT